MTETPLSRALGARQLQTGVHLEAPPATTDETLGRYPVVDALGAGGMGQVVEVLDPDLGRTVACKVMHAHHEVQRASVHKFVQEAQITGQLEHPHIVPVHELAAGGVDGRVYFTMKAVRGTDLGRLLDGDAPPGLAALLRIFLKVCEGVAFAHSKGVVHRDLKPSNIMVGPYGEVLVMDWGLAKVLAAGADPVAPSLTPDPASEADGDALRTMDGAILGTPAYMSPEQARGEVERLDARADVYALGAILYRILAGVPPHQGETTYQLLLNVAGGRWTPPGERAPGRQVPWELEAVVAKAMALEPGLRYAGVDALRADVERYLEGGLLGAARYTPLQRAGRWLRRRRGPVAAVVLAVAAALVGLGWQAHRRAVARRAQVDRAAALIERHRATIDALAGRPAALSEDDRQRAAREQLMGDCLEAVSLLEPVLAEAPTGRVRALRAAAGRALGAVALAGRDYTLARRAFLDLARYGVPATEAAALADGVDQARTRRATALRARLAAIQHALTAGLTREATLTDHVFETVGYRDPVTVAHVAGILASLAARRARTAADWTPLERRLAGYACAVLGRINLPGARAPLERWLAGLKDRALAVTAARALCDTRQPEAYAALEAARDRFGRRSEMWRQVAPRLPRLGRRGTTPAVSSDAALLDRAHARRRTGQLAAAIADYTAFLARHPRDAGAHNDRGLARHETGDVTGALADFDRAIALAPRAAYHNNRGRSWQAAGDLVKAEADFDRSLALDPRFALAHANRAGIRIVRDRPADALADCEAALKLAPDTTIAWVFKGHALHDLRRDADALRAFDRALALDPEHVEARALRGRTRMALGDLDGAEADLQAAAARAPEHALIQTDLGKLLRRRGKLEEAGRALDRAIALAPRLAAPRCHRGGLRLARGDIDGALADLDRAIALDPTIPLAWSYRGQARGRRGQFEPALADLRQALKLAARNASFNAEYGWLLFHARRPAEAEAALDRAIALDPRHGPAHERRGLVRLRRQNAAGARTDLDRAIALSPDRGRAYFYRALCRQQTGDTVGARRDLDRAIERTPGHAASHNARGALHLRAGRHALAVTDFATSARLEPERWQTWANLGEARLAAGSRAAALEAFTRARALAPPGARPQLDRRIAAIRR